MTNEQFIRNAYQVAEIKDIPGWVASFTPDGTFTDESLGVTYRGPNELGRPVEIYAQAFPDMHRELYEVIVQGDIVTVELSLNGTRTGPLVSVAKCWQKQIPRPVRAQTQKTAGPEGTGAGTHRRRR